MPNKAHDHVHRLVRSMTSTEKRYFKVHTGRHGQGTGQHELFDAIAAMEVYDEAALLERFRDQAFSHHFAITKRRLYASILRCLEAYHADGSVDARLHGMLRQVDLLHERALYEDAAKLLQGTRRLARQHDRRAILLALQDRERKLLEQGNYGKARLSDVERLATGSAELLAEQAELDTLWDLKSRVFLLLYREGRARDMAMRAALDEALDHPLLDIATPLRSAHARFLRLHILGAAAFALGDLNTCHAHLFANLELLRAEKEKFMDDPSLVIGVMSNLVHVCDSLGRTDEAGQLLQEFRTLPATWAMPETEDLETKLFISTNSLELSLLMRSGEFGRALDLVPSIEKGLRRHAGRMGPVRRGAFLYQVAFAHFAAGHPDQAVKWLHRLLNDVRIDESAEIVSFARLLDLLALYEAGRTDLLAYALRNTERMLRARSRTHRFEPVYLELVRQLLKGGDGATIDRAIGAFLGKVRALEGDPQEHAAFDHLDPIAWAVARLEGRAFAEVVRERARRVGRAA
ncbi:MAG: hypothetical protein KIT10_12115 [Flavobacteriales bacterium]|nr:hypothetical protein [Flavobacteriales bacterium]